MTWFIFWVWVAERLELIANHDLVTYRILIYKVSGSDAKNLYT